MIERLNKLVNNVRWKYFTNLQAGYTYQAVHNEIYQVHIIIEEGR